MTMIERHITPRDGGNEALRQLYETAFPQAEQIPWEELVALSGDPHIDFTAYYLSPGTLLGLTIVYRGERHNWFWYFAVSEALRGQGYGQHILEQIMARYRQRPLILDMEAPEQHSPNHEQRLRRLHFYARNGFHDTRAHRTYDGITYTIMMLGPGSFTDADYTAIIAELRRLWPPAPKS